jgi:hypothetical protein
MLKEREEGDVRQALDVGGRSVAVAFWNLGAQTRSYPGSRPA